MVGAAFVVVVALAILEAVFDVSVNLNSIGALVSLVALLVAVILRGPKCKECGKYSDACRCNSLENFSRRHRDKKPEE